MTNRELSIILRLKDEATKRLTGIRGELQKFSNSWKKNWLAITAAITAGILAVKRALDLINIGAQSKQIEDAYHRIAVAIGEDSAYLKKELMAASKETINFSNVAANVSSVLGQGLGAKQVIDLMRVARAEARKTGKSVEEAFIEITNSISGAGTNLQTLKKTYGIAVDGANAISRYARETGLSAEEVKKLHKAQALANEIIRAGKTDLAAFNLEQTTSLEHLQSLSAWWSSVRENFGQGLFLFIQRFQQFYHAAGAGFADINATMADFFSGMFKWIQTALEYWSKLPFIGDKVSGTIANISQMTEELKRQSAGFRELANEQRAVVGEIENIINADDRLTGSQLSAVQEMIRNMKDVEDETGSSFSSMEAIATQSAQNIQNAFSDFFFKAFTGELDTIKEVFASFGEAVMRMLAEIAAQILLIKTLKAWAGGNTLFGMDIDKMFHSGGMVNKYHNGGPVYAHSGYLASSEVPAILQTGEGVVSRRGMSRLGEGNLRKLNRGEATNGEGEGGSPNIFVIQAWDAQDITRNIGTISSALIDKMSLNGQLRGAINKYR